MARADGRRLVPRGPWERPPGNEPGPDHGAGGGWLWWAVIVGGVGLLAIALNVLFPGALSSGDDWSRLLYLVALLAFVSTGAAFGRRRFNAKSVQYAAAWIAVAAVLLLGYTYRFQLAGIGRDVVSVLAPGLAQDGAEGELSVRLSEDNHFWIIAEVEGVPVRFMVDTGASDVILSPADARRVGLDSASLNFSKRYRTANGAVRGAPVRLGQIVIGRLVMKDVEASVNGAPMSGSLLGMSFLNRLRGYQVDGDRLILRW